MVPERFHNGTDPEPQHNITELNLTKKNRGEADKPPTRHRFSPPSVNEVRAYCQENGFNTIDPTRFVDYYAASGWMMGKNPMQDWKAAVRTWARRDKAEDPIEEEFPFGKPWTVV